MIGLLVGELKTLMRKERFIYNKQTLRYEKVVEPLSTTLLRIFGFVCAAIFTAFLFTLLMHEYFPSPKERELARQLEELQAEIQQKESDIDQALAVMDNCSSAMPMPTG